MGTLFWRVKIMKFSKVLAFGFVGLAGLAPGMATAQVAPMAGSLPACRGIPASDWSASMLTNRADITNVQEIRPETPASETESVVQRWGARLILQAQPGMTAEWLQRVAECHRAQVSAADPSQLTQSPLDVKGARITVQSTGNGFAVDITSGDPRVGRDILARAQGLARPPAPRPVQNPPAPAPNPLPLAPAPLHTP
jgi:hypothetical protein